MTRKTILTVVRIASLICVAAVCVTAFIFSGADGKSSAKVSQNISNAIVERQVASGEKFERTKEEKMKNREEMGSFLRKCAHVAEFFILGLSAGVFAASFYTGADGEAAFARDDRANEGARAKRKKRSRHIAPLLLFATLFCILYAASDEFHQYYVPGRQAAVIDIFLDGAASLAGVLIAGGVSLAVFERAAGLPVTNAGGAPDPEDEEDPADGGYADGTPAA